jgi:hypothetical protein
MLPHPQKFEFQKKLQQINRYGPYASNDMRFDVVA